MCTCEVGVRQRNQRRASRVHLQDKDPRGQAPVAESRALGPGGGTAPRQAQGPSGGGAVRLSPRAGAPPRHQQAGLCVASRGDTHSSRSCQRRLRGGRAGETVAAALLRNHCNEFGLEAVSHPLCTRGVTGRCLRRFPEPSCASSLTPCAQGLSEPRSQTPTRCNYCQKQHMERVSGELPAPQRQLVSLHGCPTCRSGLLSHEKRWGRPAAGRRG